MKVLIAPNAFKGSLTAAQAAEAIAAGLRSVDPLLPCDLLPISDGGDGFLSTMLVASGATRHQVLVRGPVHSPVGAAFGLGGGGLALVEAAQAAGLALLAPGAGDPLGASTGGVGEVMREARQRGALSFLVGVGGTATTDGGTGMARALGYRFLDAAGAELPEGGGHLHRLARIDARDFDPAWLLLPVTVVCDVDNAFTGPNGAAAVYAPQKGASPDQVAILEAGLLRLAEVIHSDLGFDVTTLPGAGAAGGLAGGLAAFLGAHLRAGGPAVLHALGFDDRLRAASLVITGEGRLDGQSLAGKGPVVVGRLARAAGVRAVALVGSTGPGWEGSLGDAFDEVRVIVPPSLSPRSALGEADRLLREAAAALWAITMHSN